MPANPVKTPHVYRGRFAPSPTGPLHFGSLVAAVASYLQAKQNDGEWLVRIEDIDPQREIPDASTSILKSLDAHGFEYPAPLYQSSRLNIYDDVIAKLIKSDLAYACSCTRKNLQATAATGRAGVIYPGYCRKGADQSARKATSVRLRTLKEDVQFTDALQGQQSCEIYTEIGDFLIRRGDGNVAYQLAVVIDDYEQSISQVVRGTDLLDSTFMQIWLQRKLDYVTPQYMHVPIALGACGEKLSKQTGAAELDSNNAVKNIFQALVFMQQNPDAALQRAAITDVWAWAMENWDASLLRGIRTLPDRSMIFQ
jgi:glutamyl-Q tRNA(Asp) synthetase